MADGETRASMRGGRPHPKAGHEICRVYAVSDPSVINSMGSYIGRE